MKFLLDTDSVSFALRGEGNVAQRLADRSPSEFGLSAISLAELRFGAERRGSRRLHRLIDAFISNIEVVPFDPAAADRFGKVATRLQANGTPIGSQDTLIASHALSLGLTLITHNTEHFRNVRGLQSEDWFTQ